MGLPSGRHASQKSGLPTRNLGQLVDVALEDTTLLHKMLHALVTGRDLPTTVPGNSRDMPPLLAPYVMTEVFRKVNHFMARVRMSVETRAAHNTTPLACAPRDERRATSDDATRRARSIVTRA